MKSHGLGKHWKEIYYTYLKIPRVYDKTNRYISLFQDIGWREEFVDIIASRLKKKKNATILDAGSGPGTMSDILLKKKNARYVLLDYSVPMLDLADKKYERIQGSFESLPFRDNMFDGIVMGFSFHSSISMERTVEEIARVGREYLGIVGIGKSKKASARMLGEIYLRYVMPILAFAASPSHYKHFRKIQKIYSYIPDNEEMHRIIGKRFSTIAFREREMGTVFQFAGRKRR